MLVVDQASRDRILSYIDEAEKGGAKMLVDGRSWAKTTEGFWVCFAILHIINYMFSYSISRLGQP